MRRRLARALIIPAVVGAALLAIPTTAQAGQKPRTDYLDQPRHGHDAVQHLGARLPEVAAKNASSTAAFKRRLETDASYWVDRSGQAFFVEATAQAPTGDPTLTPPTDIADADTFLLHSKPGSNRVIYVDFDGEVVQGTGWNQSYTGGAPFTAEPYDIDGSPSTFSSAELDVVQSVWQRMAEDFAPFDVDVTTEAPLASDIERVGSTDLRFGTRALITNTNTVYSSCGCGGIAYVGTFDITSSHSYYQPALVFQRGLGGGAKNLAEAASHEVGHNLGLSHDGTPSTGYYGGHGAWAPIMGVGYNRPVSQWSKGEYANANNLEDDFTVMAANGAALRADDHGSTAGTATALTSPAGSATGRIGTRTDVDAFTVAAGAGPATISVTPAPSSANLDVLLQVYDAAGTLVASADPAASYVSRDAVTGLGASVDLVLAAGTYTVTVDGVGVGSPATDGYSDYGSVGGYTVAATVTPTTAPPPPPPPPPATPPAAPTAATATVSGSSVLVGWTDNATDETSFQLVREKWNPKKNSWGSAVVIANPAANATSYTDAPGAGTWRYRIKAVNAAGSSAQAVTAGVTIGKSTGRTPPA